MSATDILGKIGEKVGGEFSDLRVSLQNLYATKAELENVANTIDFSPYATKTSLETVETSITNLVSGTDSFTDLKATRAEIGDLIVNGTTTTLNTQTLSVEDNIIEVNLKSDGSETAQTGGIEINRGNGQVAIPSFTATNFNVVSDSGVGRSASNKWFAEYRNGAQDKITISPTETRFINFDGDVNILIESGTAHLDSGQFTDTSVFSMTINTNLDGSGFIQEFALTSSGQDATIVDKAKLIWDDTAGEFKALLGSTATALSVNEIKVPNSAGVKINNVALGDYSTFESAFNTANS